MDPTTTNSRQNENHVELFVRAGKDGEKLGGCPFCHKIFMELLIKAEFNNNISLVITTINTSKPPSDFKRISTRLPALLHQGQVINDLDEIDLYINKIYPHPPLALTFESEVISAVNGFFSKFSFYIKNITNSPQPLLLELARLNNFLSKSPFKFLSRDFPDQIDCQTLPKLQHLRVAGKFFKNFIIPSSFSALWNYLKQAYLTESFINSCPSDQEIIYHWAVKLYNNSKSRLNITMETKIASNHHQDEFSSLLTLLNESPPTYSFDSPT